MKDQEHPRYYFNDAGHLSLEALEYLSGKALPEAVRKHLESCELCREALEGFGMDIPGKPHKRVVEEIHLDLRQRTFSRRSLVRARQRNWKVQNWPFYMAMAAAVLAIVAYFTFLPRPGQQSSDQLARQQEVTAPVKHPAGSLESPVRKESLPGEEIQAPAPEKTTGPALAESRPDEPAIDRLTEAESPVPADSLAMQSVPAVAGMPAPDSAVIKTEAVYLAAEEQALKEQVAAGREMDLVQEDRELARPAAASKRVSAPSRGVLFLPGIQDSLFVTIRGAEFGFRMKDGIPVSDSGYVQFPAFQSPGYSDFIQYLEDQLSSVDRKRINATSGLVELSFQIPADGRPASPRIIQSPDPALGQEIIKLILSSPAWKPARIGEEAVTSTLRYQIRLRDL